MKGLPFVLLFTAMTFVAWGAYGPVLHHGAVALEHDSMRAFVGVGLAYFLIAVIFPVLIMRKGGEKGNWTVTGAIYSLVAGAVGAIGALGIILALGYGGQTVYVMPLVFGFAPVVNTLVTAMLSRTFNQISPIFIVGIVTAALGAGGVLYFKPTPAKSTTTLTSPSEDTSAEEVTSAPEEDEAEEDIAEEEDDADVNSVDDEAATLPAEAENDEQAQPAPEPSEPEPAVEEVPAPADEDDAPLEPADETPADSDDADAAINQSATADAASLLATVEPRIARKPEVSDDESEGDEDSDAASKPRAVHGFMVALSIIIAALCWGSYGPMLHIGQSKMNGSRLRPFTCVGLAYFFIAVAAPIFIIYSRTADQGAWTAGGMTWSFLAGVAGAIGALGVILAFNAGGKPYYVMPLIFGFAPVINTFISLSESGTWGKASTLFWISLAVVITGAVTVLTNAPKPKPAAAT